jgi:hypothetical protein
MMTFACTLEDEALEWYENLGRKEISSLADFIKVFLKHWDPHYEEDKYEKVFEDLRTAASEEDIVVEAFPSSPMEDQAHEEAPHVSIEDLHEEDIVGDGASTSSTQEVKGLVSFDTSQNFDFDGVFSYDFEQSNLEDKPLEEEYCLDLFKGSHVDQIFPISNHSGDVDCWIFYGDPIYDTSSENFEDYSADFGAFGQPYVVDELAENEEVKSEILQPCFPMHTSDLFQPLHHVYDSDNSKFFHPFSAIHSSEIFRNWMMKVLEIFSHLLLQICVNLLVIFQLESVFLVLEIVWGSKILSADFMTSHFQPSNSEQNLFPDLKFHFLPHPYAW